MFQSTPNQKALASWLLDVAAVVVVAVLLPAWVHDFHNHNNESSSSASLPRLAPSFLERGFCLSEGGIIDTHLLCAMFDTILGVAFLVAAATGVKSKNLIPLASYVLSHGYGHYQASSLEYLESSSTISTKDLLTLAAILSIGPWGGMSVVQKRFFGEKRSSKTSKVVFWGGVLVGVLALVALYVYGLGQQRNFSLLYINLSILFTSSLPSALLTSYTNTADRVHPYPHFWLAALGRAAVVGLVLVEPFYCDSFLSDYGGHFLFDLALGWDAVMNVVNEVASSRSAPSQGNDKAKVKFV